MREYYRICSHNYNNAGDSILNAIQEIAFQHVLGDDISFIRRTPHERFTEETAAEASNTNAIIVGGGGLICKSPDYEGSWQWNITPEGIEAIDVPVYLFAVGYNQFRGQDALMDDRFRREFNQLADKCEYIGLRNQGSIDRLSDFLTKENCEKIRFQPCTTTIISKLCNLPKADASERIIGFNLAIDRREARFGNEAVLNRMLLAFLKLAAQLFANGYRIAVYSHVNGDEALYNFFCKYGLPCEHVDLRPASSTACVNTLIEYAKPELVIGMRGHAQMIPFGCRVPIVSVISHEKMRYFLNDIGHNEWGIDVNDEQFSDRLIETVDYVLNNRESIISEIDLIQNRLYDVTRQNILDIGRQG